MNGYRRMASKGDDPSDEELMCQLAGGSAEALGLLHRRFARLILGVAAHTLDRAAAEDLGATRHPRRRRHRGKTPSKPWPAG